VLSVTSEAPTNVSFQPPPQRAATFDQSQQNDSFGALVDSNVAADTSAAPAAPTHSAAPRRADDVPAVTDTRASGTAAADRAANNAAADRDAAARQTSNANADANASANADANAAANAKADTKADTNADADAAPPSQAKSTDSKADTGKSTEKPSSDSNPESDQTSSASQVGPAVTPIAVAIAVPVAIVPAIVPAATPAAGDASAPLAIAATAIAAASPATAASPAAQTKITATAAAATAAATATATATATVDEKTAQADASAATTATETGSVTIATTAQVAPKPTLLKTPAAPGPTKSAAPDVADSTADTPGSAAPIGAAHSTVTPPPAVAAKQDPGKGLGDAAKTDASVSASSASGTAGLAQQQSSPAAGTEPTLADSSNTVVPVTGTFQAQLTAASGAPAPSLSVTAATNAPVPLSGLALEIATSARSGKSRFDIRLDPAELGRIDVRIDVDRNGQVTSHLTVEKPETLSLLRQDAPQLQRALDDAGLKTGSGGLQFSLRDQSSSGQNNGNESGRNAHRLVISDNDVLPAAIAGRTYGRISGSNSGVDIRV
jgi:flagellar hook-length control protein FliK